MQGLRAQFHHRAFDCGETSFVYVILFLILRGGRDVTKKAKRGYARSVV